MSFGGVSDEFENISTSKNKAETRPKLIFTNIEFGTCFRRLFSDDFVYDGEIRAVGDRKTAFPTAELRTMDDNPKKMYSYSGIQKLCFRISQKAQNTHIGSIIK